MSLPRALPPHPLPVLTEIVESPAEPTPDAGPGGLAITEGELISRVMRELELQVDLMLETRLREILAPAIARATDQMIREARDDLASMLGEILSRAVVQELSRSRAR
ncbi:hypothetical protein [Caldimonas tepidiphila]|uniref:hypothetical protein n=1 Tax=Caldimonas tepidiphila TaxID=2315841 RepID=UPI000E5BFBB1|nr:hypothetical protein [Caldimonas tepidiphila]